MGEPEEEKDTQRVFFPANGEPGMARPGLIEAAEVTPRRARLKLSETLIMTNESVKYAD